MSLPHTLLFLALILFPALATAQDMASPTTEPAPRNLHLQFEAAPPSTSARSAYTTGLPASSPLRRTAPTDSRLTCDDYSMSYFRRHPAMAEVCDVDITEQPTPEIVSTSVTILSTTQP